MKCPFCRQTNTEVYNTRTTRFGTQTWRRRRCLSCGQSFTTYEAPDLSFLKIAPKASKPERYNRAMLFSSIYTVFAEIPHKDGVVDAITDTVEAKILDLQQTTVTTAQVSRIILTTLKHFDTNAFVRYLTTQTGFISSAQLAKELKKY